jgi:hypothetical protein
MTHTKFFRELLYVEIPGTSSLPLGGEEIRELRQLNGPGDKTDKAGTGEEGDIKPFF